MKSRTPRLHPVGRFLSAGICLGTMLLLLASCSGSTGILRISSSIPETTLLAEMYQQEHPETIIEILDDNDPRHHLEDDKEVDLLIDRGLNNPALYRNLDDLSTYGETLMANMASAYEFARVTDGKRVPLLMLAFDLPGITSLHSRNELESAETLVLDMNELRRNSKENAAKPDTRISSMYFSPLYDSEFILLVCRSFGSKTSADRQGYPEWNKEFLAAGIAYLRAWSTEATGSPEAESAFLDRYAYIPLSSLITAGSIRAGYMRASTFFALPAYVRSDLTFHYLSWGGSISILDNAVYTGIPKNSKNRETAHKFLAWLCQAQTQKKYLVKLRDEGLENFGFLGGFPTLRIASEKYLPMQNTAVKGMIVPEHLLTPPDPVPLAWFNYRDSILLPFLQSAVRNEAGMKDSDLKDRTARWYLQQGFDARF